MTTLFVAKPLDVDSEYYIQVTLKVVSTGDNYNFNMSHPVVLQNCNNLLRQ